MENPNLKWLISGKVALSYKANLSMAKVEFHSPWIRIPMAPRFIYVPVHEWFNIHIHLYDELNIGI